MTFRRHQPYVLLGSVMLNLMLLVILFAHKDAHRAGDLLAASPPGATPTGQLCPVASTNVSGREAARRLDEKQLQQLLETPSHLLDVNVLLKRLEAASAYNTLLEQESIAKQKTYHDKLAEVSALAAKKPPSLNIVGDKSDQSDGRNADSLGATERRIATRIDCRDRDYRSEILQRGSYWVLNNFMRAEHGRLRCFESVTYTTHADYTFLENLQPLLERWQAPISIALFAPGTDLNRTLDSIRHVRDCGPHSQFVRQYATFHIYFPQEYMPPAVPNASVVARTRFDCRRPAPYARLPNGTEQTSVYRSAHALLYPVNVGRNIARDAAMTHFVLPSDIELYPNPGLARQFLEMVAQLADAPRLRTVVPYVWPLVLFEVAENATVPANKTVLQRMLANGTAITFHKRVCASCHGVPKMKEWMAAPEMKAMAVFHVGKRVGPQYHWEPVYIGTHAEPHYDERLTWEGMSDKMTQGYAMCALGYEFRILNNGFMVHRPGIKVFHKDEKRAALQAQTNRMIRSVINKELKLMYGWRKGCAV